MADLENRLTLVREISRSGIATVSEAYDSGLDRKVLVKSIHPQFIAEPDLRARFEREARAIARLSHPNVVGIYDLRATEQEFSLFLEYVDGVTLGKLLKDRNKLPFEIAFTIAVEILSGLEHAHAAGIVHRDLKPDNVIVSNKGEVKITDFGLASFRDQPTVTMEGMVIGTPAYMAPEQANSETITPRTDLFALGLMIFEMLTSKRLISGNSWGDTFQAILTYSPPRLEQYKDDIPTSVAAILQKLLERSADKRYASAKEVSDALLAAEPDAYLPTSLLQDYLIGGEIVRPSKPRTAAPKEKSLWLNTAVVIILLLVVAVSIYNIAAKREILPEQKFAKDSINAVKSDSGMSGEVSDSLLNVGINNQDSTAEIPVTIDNTNNNVAVKPVKPDSIQSSGFGLLTIQSKPWAKVFIKDSLWGTTPLSSSLRLGEGSHNIVLTNPEIPQPIIRTVEIQANKSVNLEVNLYDFVARIRVANVKPWADVYIDGVKELRTPSNKVIIRPLGTYKITLKNSGFPDYTKEVSFRQGDPIYEIRYDFKDSASQ